ncbi:MAG: hypothetical protein ACTSXS_01330 [Candidatus Thorarchaeota archaeon]
MGVRKWMMKQYWRLVQVRGIWNLFYGILLLSVAYYIYVPIFVDLGAIGPFIFALIMFTIFLILGYLYDRVFVLWGPQQEVAIERNPFQYVPHPRDKVFWFPVYSVLLDSSEQILEKLGRDTTPIKETREYFAKLLTFTPYSHDDLQEAIKLRDEYIANHRFADLVGK